MYVCGSCLISLLNRYFSELIEKDMYVKMEMVNFPTKMWCLIFPIRNSKVVSGQLAGLLNIGVSAIKVETLARLLH